MQNAVYALVSVERRFIDTCSGLAVDTTWHPEAYAAAEGIVVSAPEKITGDQYRKVISNVRKGDTVFFSYAVIFDYIMQPDDDTPVYKNLLLHEGKEYWKVPLSEVFARKDEFGLWGMTTDMVMVKPIVWEHAGILVRQQEVNRGIVIALPNKTTDFSIYDLVVFEPRYAQRYTIGGETRYLLPTRRILAKEN